MRKHFGLILGACLLSLALCACGSDTDDHNTVDTTEKAYESATATDITGRELQDMINEAQSAAEKNG